MKKEPFGWEEFRKRTDIIKGTLEVFLQDGPEPRPDFDLQYRGVIEQVTWGKDGFPIFHISSSKQFDFKSDQWLVNGPELIEFATIFGPDHNRVYEYGSYLFIPGLGRYLIIPSGVDVPEKPIFKPVSYTKFEEKIVRSLSAK